MMNLIYGILSADNGVRKKILSKHYVQNLILFFSVAPTESDYDYMDYEDTWNEMKKNPGQGKEKKSYNGIRY